MFCKTKLFHTITKHKIAIRIINIFIVCVQMSEINKILDVETSKH